MNWKKFPVQALTLWGGGLAGILFGLLASEYPLMIGDIKIVNTQVFGIWGASAGWAVGYYEKTNRYYWAKGEHARFTKQCAIGGLILGGVIDGAKNLSLA